MSWLRTDILDDSQSTLKKIVILGWPATVSMLFHTSYVITDMFWVSRLGREAVAAVGLTGIVMWTVFALSQVFAVGVHALVARAHGAGEPLRAETVLHHAMTLALGSGLLLGIAVASWPGWLLEILGARQDVVETGIPYVRVMAVGGTGLVSLFTLTSAFRGAGDMVTPLVLSAVSSAFNMILDPLLVLGIGPFPELGLTGAGVASALAIFLSLGGGIILTMRPAAAVRLRPFLSFDRAVLRDLMAIGIPSGLHYVLLNCVQIALTRMTAVFGTTPVAAATIGGKITQLSFLPCIGIGTATATLVGQYLGAGRIERAEHVVRVSIRTTFVVTAVISLFYAVFPARIVSLFSTEPTTIYLGSIYLWIFAVSLIFVSVTIVLTRVFQGAGDTVWPTIVAAIRLIFFVGAAVWAAWVLRLEATGIWLAMLVSSILQTALVWWFYMRGTWKHRALASTEMERV